MTEEMEKRVQFDSESILADRQSLLAIYAETNDSTRFVVDKIWTNARFFTTLTSALLTLSAVAFGKGLLDAPQNKQDATAYLFLAILPALVLGISYIGTKNLEREYRRFLLWTSVRAKLQELLGLCQEATFKIFPDDRYLFPVHFVESRHASSGEFISASLGAKGSLYHYFKLLHFVYALVALLLAAGMIWRGLC